MNNNGILSLLYGRDATEKDKTGRGVLGINRGLQWPDDKWAYVGYKGGSEPGVLNLTLLL